MPLVPDRGFGKWDNFLAATWAWGLIGLATLVVAAFAFPLLYLLWVKWWLFVMTF